MIVLRLLVGIVVVLRMSPVHGIQFSMTRNQIELGNPSGTDPVLTLTCTTDVDALFFRIQRETEDGSGWQAIATLTTVNGGVIASGLPSYWNSANVTGSLQDPINLAISVQASSLACDDDKTYQCEVTYLNNQLKTEIEVQNSTLSITVLPSPPNLTARKLSTNMPINTGFNQDTPATMIVGAQVELSCFANIGSDSSRTIRWQKSSEVNTGQMIDYTTNKDDGIAVQNSVSKHCTYSRTSTIRYNTTVIDSNRNEQMELRFSCFFLVNQQDTQQMFYIHVASGSGGTPNNDNNDDGTELNNRVPVIVGVMIGVLTCVIIGAITVFVVRRYQSKKGTSNSSTERPTRNQFEANNPTGDVSYYNTRENPMVQLPSHETAAEENIVGGEELMSVRTNTEATYYNEGSSHNYESLNDQNRDPTTYASLQQVSSNPTNVETSNVDTGYENLNLRVV